MACTDSRYESNTSYTQWATSQKGQLDNLNQSTAAAATILTRLQSDILTTYNCLEEKSRNIRNTADTIQTLQGDIVRIQEKLVEQEEHTKISKERLRYMSSSERPVSYYESWFPVYRPAKPITLILLITATVFMIMFSALLMLSLMGIKLNMSLAGEGASGNYLVNLLYYIRMQGLPFWIITLAFIGLLIYVLVREQIPKTQEVTSAAAS
jgi:hypothetical protein